MRYEKRLKTILPALLVVLSLLALTAPTCLCAHHEEKAAVTPSCHSEVSEHGQTVEGLSAERDCICVFAERPRAADKSTPVKITKDAVALTAKVAIDAANSSDREFTPQIVRLSNVNYERIDRDHNNSRGPPA
ncbi:MAG: hypothetical protein KF756_03620 [Acidobacteria bacterium]|nr:hypothetical protein [Acidobacteriota bacterium]